MFIKYVFYILNKCGVQNLKHVIFLIQILEVLVHSGHSCLNSWSLCLNCWNKNKQLGLLSVAVMFSKCVVCNGCSLCAASVKLVSHQTLVTPIRDSKATAFNEAIKKLVKQREHKVLQRIQNTLFIRTL